MRRWLATTVVVTALIGIPAVAGLVASSRPAEPKHGSHATHPRVQVSSAPVIGYGAPAKT